MILAIATRIEHVPEEKPFDDNRPLILRASASEGEKLYKR